MVIRIHWLLSSVRGHPPRSGLVLRSTRLWSCVCSTDNFRVLKIPPENRYLGHYRDSLFSFEACIFRYEPVVVWFTNMELFSSLNTDGETISWVIFNYREILGISTKLQGFRTYLEWRHILKGGTFSTTLLQTACISMSRPAGVVSSTQKAGVSAEATVVPVQCMWQPGGMTQKESHSWWFKVTLLSPSWRSRFTFEFGWRELTIPKSSRLQNCQVLGSDS